MAEKTVKEAKFKMSPERLDALRAELTHLQTVREKEVAEQIKEARSFGDLSENSEYEEAKNEQSKLYARIAEINNLIENAEIFETADTDGKVGVGSAALVIDLEDGSETEYRIVGSQEANPANNMISDDSPFGKALIGCVPGDEFVVEAPAGKLRFKLKEVK
ncbi:MAG: transcription elongation factor GreA [Oscillospiraceae bacterium]|jgi:transcription elongation factor GreA|nr:transcription elongation factor GreA [Oscillospiraceae bacterium]